MKLLESPLYIEDLNRVIKNINLSKLIDRSIFISGGLGLICSAIVDILIIYGKVDVYVGARNYDHFQKRFAGYERVHFVQYDALNNISFNFKTDYIIHGAGLASPELYTTMPVETILSNFNGVHNLLEFAQNNGVKRLLYLSSSEVYGKKDTNSPYVEGNYGEIDIDSLRSSYAIAKRASEMICKAYYSEYGIDTVVVRPGHIFGPSAKVTDKRISSEFAFKAANGEKLEMKSSGLQKRSYCYSLDCAVQILTILLNGESGEVYNIGHDEITTISDMALLLAKAGNVELTIAEPTEVELKGFNPMNNSSLDNSRVKKLGYKDIFSVEEGVNHTVKILKELN